MVCSVSFAWMATTSTHQATIPEDFLMRQIVGGIGICIAAGFGVMGVLCRLHRPNRARPKQDDAPSAYDGVTGLPTRRLFLVLLKQALSRAEATKRNVAVFVCSLDQVYCASTASAVSNRTLVVRVQAARIKSALQPHDVVARLDEHMFAVIADNLESPDQASAIAKKVTITMSLPLLIEGQEVLLSCRIGRVAAPQGRIDAETLLEAALDTLSTSQPTDDSMAVASGLTASTSSSSSLTYAGGIRQ
jgi:GGDEF domain-containing protein